MTEAYQTIEERKQHLKKLQESLKNSLALAPFGTLRIRNDQGAVRYYRRKGPEDTNGVYLPVGKREMAIRLAQKEYDKKCLQAVEKELAAIEAYLRYSPGAGHFPEEVFGTLTDEKKRLVVPIMDPDDIFLEKWKHFEYDKKGFAEDAPEFWTEKGERVRSKAEILIANTMYRAGVWYRYECPLYLKGYGIIYPDFTALNLRLRKTIYWEHRGMMDDPAYAVKAIKKEWLYQRNGIFAGDTLIVTSETKNYPITIPQIEGIIEHYLL